MIKIKKGLDLPIVGVPSQKVFNGELVSEVAVTGSDYRGMKPTMLVKIGDRVRVGDPLFECKKVPGVLYTSPGCGVVKAINRGARRVFQNIVISLEGEEQKSFEHYRGKSLQDCSGEEVEELMVEAGLWPAFRTRPFSKAPQLKSRPASIFVSVMDTNPLAADPEVIVAEYRDDFLNGLKALGKICPKVFVTRRKGGEIPKIEGVDFELRVEESLGPHPAGLVGTHIHFLDPVSLAKTVWHIGYQDVIALGRLMTKGEVFLERIISLAGPRVKNPRLLRTRLGASLTELTHQQLHEGRNRIISGSIFNGRAVDSPFSFLGRFHTQVSVLEENDKREFVAWMGPGWDKFSLKNTYAGKFKHKAFAFHTGTYGSSRAIIPVGQFEAVMPLDILPTQLLRALKTGDTDMAQQLGALELDEEDLALCTFVDPGKDDFGPVLRDILTTIEKEG